MEKLINDIKSRSFKNVYVFFGEEKYLIRKYEHEFGEALISSDTAMMNMDLFEGKDCNVGKIIDASETAPLLSEYRLVVVKNSELFASGRKDDSEKMAEYLLLVPEFTVIIFIEEKMDKRGKLYKNANTRGRCIEFVSPPENELIKFVIHLLKEKGHKGGITKEGALYLLRNVGNDMESVVCETEKLIGYKGFNGDISKEDIDKVCTKSLEVRIFDMVDAIGNKKTDVAIDIYNNLLFLKESPIMILSMIARQFRMMMQSKYLSKEGFNVNDIAARIFQRSFVIREALRQSKNFKYSTLRAALDDCLECDIKIKTGKITGDLGVEMIIIKYSA